MVQVAARASAITSTFQTEGQKEQGRKPHCLFFKATSRQSYTTLSLTFYYLKLKWDGMCKAPRAYRAWENFSLLPEPVWTQSANPWEPEMGTTLSEFSWHLDQCRLLLSSTTTPALPVPQKLRQPWWLGLQRLWQLESHRTGRIREMKKKVDIRSPQKMKEIHFPLKCHVTEDSK